MPKKRGKAEKTAPEQSVRFTDWAHDPGLRRLSAGTWAARYMEPPEYARAPIDVDQRAMAKALVRAVIDEALEAEKRPRRRSS